jgi:hypothetical protein
MSNQIVAHETYGNPLLFDKDLIANQIFLVVDEQSGKIQLCKA